MEELRTIIERQQRDLDELSDRVESLLDRQEWVQSGLYDVNLSLTLLELGEGPSAARRVAYSESVRAVREVVRRALPRDAAVLVVDKGDDLLDLYGRRVWHFPQGAEGRYAGYYPPDGTAVIAHFEAQRARGAEFLLFPGPALWWFESYPKFTSYLHRHYPVAVNDPEKCVIFALDRYQAFDLSVWKPRLLDLMDDYASETGAEASVLDWNTGFDLKELLPSQAVFSPPTGETTLPYLDQSVDIVVVGSPDEKALREARRVAGHAVVTLEPSAAGTGASGSEADAGRPAYTVEHVNGGLTRMTGSSSIIIPTYNGWDQLGRCLVALEETLPHPFEGEVIVVDDGSAEETQAVLDEWDQSSSRLNLKIIRNGSNVGFLESCNRGATAASGDFLVFLNDDTLPQFGWLTALLRTFRTHEDAGAVGGKLLYPDGKLQEAGGVIYSDGSGANYGNGDYLVDDPLFGFVREVDYCSGALLATSRKVFEEIGGFDDRYCPAYYEDTDYCFTVRDRGYKVYYQPESVVVHFEGATGGTDLSAGVKKHQVSNRAKFVKKWRSALRDQPDPPEGYDLETWHALSTRGRAGRSKQGGRALVSAPLLPEFDREGGSRRIFHMIEFLRAAGWDVSFLAENPYGDERYVRMLQRQGVAVYRGFGSRADDLFKFGKFDLAVFAFWYLAEGHATELRRVSPDTKIMVDVIDLHWLRAVRRHFLPPVGASDPNGGDSPEFGSEMVRELEAYAQADAVLTTSDEEAQMIHNLLGRQSLAHTVPDHEESIPSEVPFRDRRGILFVANFNHPPNLDAVMFFCEEILPKMDQELLEEHPLSIVGHRPPPAVLEYAESSRFINLVGWVPSVVPYLQSARVAIVPMRYGAGTKRKLLQALMSHTPTVTTSMGIEGLSVEPGRHALLADDAESFAEATERLLRDAKLWARLSQNGSEGVGKVHSREAVLDRLNEVVEAQMGRPALRLLDSVD